MLPAFVRCRARLTDPSAGRAAPELLERAVAAGFPAPRTWRDGPSGRARKLPVGPAGPPDAGIVYEAGEGTFLDVSRLGAKPTLLQVYVATATEDDVVHAQHALVTLLRGLAGEGRLLDAEVDRPEARTDALPLSAVGKGLVARLVPTADVGAAYRDPAAFWAAWDGRDERGESTFAWRGLDCGTTAAWVRARFPTEWAAARAARPGHTRIGRRIVPEGCEDLVALPRPALVVSGVAAGLAQLAATPGARVTPAEVLAVAETIRRRSLDDGRPFERMRVVFRSEEAAWADGVPLADAGADVAWLGRDGLWHSLAGGPPTPT